jgi:hypothetical protein
LWTGRSGAALRPAAQAAVSTRGLDELLTWLKEELSVVESLTTIVLRHFR